MPARLRPTAPIAAEAILVGDPGRALMLAQELLAEPKMSNHARGLWGYTGTTEAGRALSIQATGMGGPSAAVVLADLAELGVRRAVRIGTCTSLGELDLGDLLLVTEARPFDRSLSLPDTDKEQANAKPDEGLTAALARAAPFARPESLVSLDGLHRPEGDMPEEIAAADMQTAALFAAAEWLGVAVAALLVVTGRGDSDQLADADLEAAAKRAGHAAVGVL